MTKKINLKKIYKEPYIKFLEKFMLKHDEKEIEDLFIKSFNETPEMFQKTVSIQGYAGVFENVNI